MSGGFNGIITTLVIAGILIGAAVAGLIWFLQ